MIDLFLWCFHFMVIIFFFSFFLSWGFFQLLLEMSEQNVKKQNVLLNSHHVFPFNVNFEIHKQNFKIFKGVSIAYLLFFFTEYQPPQSFNSTLGYK